MQMYQWDSKYLEQYATGDIIVIAKTVEEAREKVMSKYDEYDNEHYESEHLEKDVWEDEIRERKAILQKDIAVEPKICDVLFISGSQ